MGLAIGNLRPGIIDPKTGVLIGIDYEHHSVHEAFHFNYFDSITLGSGASQVYLLETGNRFVHFQKSVLHSALSTIDVYEGADRVGTTLQTAFNNQRNSILTPEMMIHKGISGGTTDGTLLQNYSFGFASAFSRLGGDSRNQEEVVLKINTKYLMRVASSTNGQLFVVNFNWYEITPKNL